MFSQETGPVAAEITRRLTQALAPTQLRVIDDSESHRGHGGYNARSGESHFTVIVVSAEFAGLGRVERQRRVNAALREELAGPVHALSIRAMTPAEAAEN